MHLSKRATPRGWPIYGIHSMQRQRIRADLIITFKIFTLLLDVDQNLFLPPTRRGLQGTPRYEPPPEERVGVLVRAVIYSIKLPASVVTAPSVNSFKKRLSQVWTEDFPHLPNWLKFVNFCLKYRHFFYCMELLLLINKSSHGIICSCIMRYINR